MDFLKAEIANKRKALHPPSAASAPTSSSSSPPGASATTTAEPPSKYMRRGDLERLQEQQRKAEQQKKRQHEQDRLRDQQAQKATPTAAAEPDQSASGSSTPRKSETGCSASPAPTTAVGAASSSTKEAFNISNHEAIRRLRAKGQPIRIFAETDKERRLRLRALELIEEKGSGSGQNDFRSAMQSAESGMALELLERRNASDKGKAERDRLLEGANKDGADGGSAAATASNSKEAEDGAKKGQEYVGMDKVLDLELIKKDTARVYPIIYYTLKGLLQDWADHLSARPDEVKQTTQGKLAAATQVQSSEYLKPLFKELRKRTLAPDVLMRIAEIVHYMQKRQYRFASDSYLQLSIGNAPWPLGVTMVGIHERSGREKIFSSNVAHVLNDEVSRKYIQSLKRLMTFAQTKYPPEDLSMLMG